MRKIEHIGIAVKDLDVSNLIFEKLFGASAYKHEEVESEGVLTSFFKSGPNKIELLAATNPESPIAKFLEKKGEGIHHIAEGFVVLNDVPKKGADNKLVAFLHPKSTNGVLIELCQEIK
jgi:methylmalonyl-CoA/ethylmalonyl-CoA epimerase